MEMPPDQDSTPLTDDVTDAGVSRTVLQGAEGRRLLDLLAIGDGAVLLDVACGTGGPGLWVAQQTRASLIGFDPSAAGLAEAARRARRVGLGDRSRFQEGTFERTGLADGTADAVMSIGAFQYDRAAGVRR